VNDAHSIYFEIFVEKGWIGLFLFLLLAAMTWRSCSKMINTYRHVPDKKWVVELAAMVQVSLIGYYVSGAFLGLAYYDYYYNLIAVTIILAKLATQPSNNGVAAAPSTSTKLPPQPRRLTALINTKRS
jgi:O-antigen ligase